ncbi:TIGR03089 family protein [Stackebrandtia nassauensis]|uniref:TIGR03089 family protein n=1 Tax=Stackebrandtia nassauensis (strain DSM 44728 / CIP 108903 / NRRL B-16338 / NBRC 102104 / LLR-40K-21) TaxID=446470 RepID=D3Q507_STANL|nr:TIGR03089 family protein [Stackebrandtia nassauensis]ADD42187.1 hypothetical protein Snas_2505 [Stackebrandtia nassauensis DSM 44728]
MNTVDSLFAAAAKPDPARPFLTYYDDATGERTELSYVTMDNWVSKTANLLLEHAYAEPGATAELRLPPHWLGAAVMLGCWRAGVAISHAVAGESGVDRDQPYVLFDTEDELRAPEDTPQEATYTVSLAPLAVGLRSPAARQRVADNEAVDFLTEVRGYGDHFGGAPAAADAPALVGLPGGRELTQAQLVESARTRAGEMGLGDGERIMFTDERIRPLDWLLVPLAVKGSVVLSRNSTGDTAKRADSERARVV